MLHVYVDIAYLKCPILHKYYITLTEWLCHMTESNYHGCFSGYTVIPIAECVVSHRDPVLKRKQHKISEFVYE